MLGGMMLLFAVVGIPCIASAILERWTNEEQQERIVRLFMLERKDG